jgi:hypothetical protein
MDTQHALNTTFHSFGLIWSQNGGQIEVDDHQWGQTLDLTLYSESPYLKTYKKTPSMHYILLNHISLNCVKLSSKVAKTEIFGGFEVKLEVNDLRSQKKKIYE